jgi:hypothetical protein
MRCLNRTSSLLCFTLLSLPVLAVAQRATDPWDEAPAQRFWAGAGIGAGAVNSLAPAPAADRDAVAASIEVGYRLTPTLGFGLELGTIAPVSGCREWTCANAPSEFAPSFGRLMAFGELRPGNSGFSLRAGVGVSRFCYQRHWSEDAWSVWDSLMVIIDEEYLYDTDGGSGAWRCDASRKALGGTVSVGYEWQTTDAPISMGVRLSAEAARFSGSPALGMPAFQHRAVMLTLHLRVN